MDAGYKKASFSKAGMRNADKFGLYFGIFQDVESTSFDIRAYGMTSLVVNRIIGPKFMLV